MYTHCYTIDIMDIYVHSQYYTMDKVWYVYTILLSIKKKSYKICCCMEGTGECHGE